MWHFHNAILSEVADLFSSTDWAFDLPVRPVDRNHKVFAVFKIREIDYRVSECSVIAHVPMVALFQRYVTYILTFPKPEW